MQVRFPERPSPALFGASVVDAAFSRIRIEENTIAVGVLDEAFSRTDISDEFSLEAIEVVLIAHHVGDGLDFLFVDPDEAGFRSGAAIATSGALEG